MRDGFQMFPLVVTRGSLCASRVCHQPIFNLHCLYAGTLFPNSWKLRQTVQQKLSWKQGFRNSNSSSNSYGTLQSLRPPVLIWCTVWLKGQKYNVASCYSKTAWGERLVYHQCPVRHLLICFPLFVCSWHFVYHSTSTSTSLPPFYLGPSSYFLLLSQT